MIYPPTYPPHKTEHAEEQVYNILKTLDPDRYDVFYDRRFAQMRPGERKDYQVDFLIADLGGGRFNALLVLEVKGGIIKYNGQQNCWTQNGHVMKGDDDPIGQAMGNMHSLVKHYPEISRRVPFEWAVCFPDPANMYSRKQIPPTLTSLQLIESFALGTIGKHLPMLLEQARDAHPHLQGTDLGTYQVFKEALKQLSDSLGQWLKEQAVPVALTQIQSLFSGDATPQKINPDQKKVEDKFKKENFDLINWFIIT